jgi:hypothetical protein
MNKLIGLSLILAAVTPSALAKHVGQDKSAPSIDGGASGSATSPTRFEMVPPGEAGQIAETVDLTVKMLQQRYPTSMARRGVHPKDHGCVQASFTVNPDLPDRYRVGVFVPGKTYPAWVRFSNATATVNPDIEKGGPPSRGMAIKLMGVEGTTLLGESGLPPD